MEEPPVPPPPEPIVLDEWSVPMKFLSACAGFLLCVIVGYIYDGEESEKKKNIPTPMQLLRMPQHKQGQILNEILPNMTEEEQQEYMAELAQLIQPNLSKMANPMERESIASAPVQSQRIRAPASSSKVSQKSDEELTYLLTKADLSRQKGDLDESLACYRKALKILEKDTTLDPNHVFAAITTYAMSLVEKEKGNNEKAEELIAKVLPVLKEATDNLEKSQVEPSTFQNLSRYAEALSTLSEIQILLNRFSEAETHLSDSLKVIQKKILLVDKIPIESLEDKKQLELMKKHFRIEIAILNDKMSDLKLKQTKYAESEKLAKEALIFLVDALVENIDVLSIVITLLKRLTDTYREQERDTAPLYEDLLHAQEQKYGENSPHVLMILPLLAASYFSEQKFAQSEQYYRRSIALLGQQKESTTDKNKATLFTFMIGMASAMQEQGKDQEGQEVREIIKAKLEGTKIQPPVALSRYLKTISAAVKFEGKESLSIFYEVEVETKERNKLPSGAVLEFNFQNSYGEPYKLDYTVEEGKQLIKVKSPNISRISASYLSIDINIFSDSSKTQKIGFHCILCQCPIDATDDETMDDVELKLYEANANSNSGGGGMFNFN